MNPDNTNFTDDKNRYFLEKIMECIQKGEWDLPLLHDAYFFIHPDESGVFLPPRTFK